MSNIKTNNIDQQSYSSMVSTMKDAFRFPLNNNTVDSFHKFISPSQKQLTQQETKSTLFFRTPSSQKQNQQQTFSIKIGDDDNISVSSKKSTRSRALSTSSLSGAKQSSANRVKTVNYEELYQTHLQNSSTVSRTRVNSNHTRESTHDRIFGNSTSNSNQNNTTFSSTKPVNRLPPSQNNHQPNLGNDEKSTGSVFSNNPNNSFYKTLPFKNQNDNSSVSHMKRKNSETISVCSSTSKSLVNQLICTGCVNQVTAEENAYRRKVQRDQDNQQIIAQQNEEQRVAFEARRKREAAEVQKRNHWLAQVKEQQERELERKAAEEHQRILLAQEREKEITLIEQDQSKQIQEYRANAKAYIKDLKNQIVSKNESNEKKRLQDLQYRNILDQQARISLENYEKNIQYKVIFQDQHRRGITQQIEEKRTMLQAQSEQEQKIEQAREEAIKENIRQQKARVDEQNAIRMKQQQDFYKSSFDYKQQEKEAIRIEEMKIKAYYEELQRQQQKRFESSKERDSYLKNEVNTVLNEQLIQKQRLNEERQAEEKKQELLLKKAQELKAEQQRALLKNCEHCTALFPESHLMQKLCRKKSIEKHEPFKF